MELTKEFRFEASHVLPKHPGKCSRLHGHSWVFKISVEGEVDPKTGFVMDFYDIGVVGKKIVDLLDHTHLGVHYIELSEAVPFQVPYNWRPNTPHINQLYPTSENLLLWMANFLGDFPWSKLELNETCTSACVLTRNEFDKEKV